MRSHGTRARYVVEQCRCSACRDANSAYQRRRHGGGNHGLTELGDVRDRLEKLLASGIGPVTIARTTGLHRQTISKIANGKQTTARQSTKARLLEAVHADYFAFYVPGLGTARRLRALHAVGWTFTELGRELDVRGSWVNRLALHPRTVRAETARKVAAVYRRLENVVPPESHGSRVSRTYAQRYGWATPAAWDGVDIDDPHSKADPGWSPSDRTVADLVEDIDFLMELGETVPMIAIRLGISESYVRKLRPGRGRNGHGAAAGSDGEAQGVDEGEQGDPGGAGRASGDDAADTEPLLLREAGHAVGRPAGGAAGGDRDRVAGRSGVAISVAV